MPKLQIKFCLLINRNLVTLIAMNPTLGENKAESVTLVIPSRVDSIIFHKILRRFSHRPIVLLAEENLTICSEVMRVIENAKVDAFAFNPKDDVRKVAENLCRSLAPDTHVIYIPPALPVLKGSASQIPTSILQFLCELGLPVLPIGVHYPLESTLPTSGEETENLFHIEKLIDPAILSPSKIRQGFYSAIEQCFAQRPFSRLSLGSLIIKSLKASPNGMIEDGADDSTLSYEKLLAISMTLAGQIKKLTQQRRVAIVLPPGKAGSIANIATVLANKVPVNLNFTASTDSIESAIRQSSVDLVLSASALESKAPNFPWKFFGKPYLLDQELPKLKGKIGRTLLLNKLRSADSLIKAYNTEKFSGEKEATLLFTSGSSGEPKGVPLSHKNIVSNICQLFLRLGLEEKSNMLGCLPLFHSFGLSWGMWFPLLTGHNLVTFTSPLEQKRLAELIDKHSIKMLIVTPTFLRGYLRRAAPEQLKSLRLVITGAEKLPQKLADQFEDKFGIRPLEGYGLTETSPGAHTNLPQQDQDTSLPTSVEKSVGQPFPGVAVEIDSLDQASNGDPRQPGEILLKGPNVFNGYLNKPSLNQEILNNGWFRTGDIGYLDDDGYLHISGRLSRFSKIAGEMVPHEVVEEHITQLLGLDDADERSIAIVGAPDEKKGECLILLSTVDALVHEIKLALLKKGIPAIWAPKEVLKVAAIPILASGKLDIKACKGLVDNRETA